MDETPRLFVDDVDMHVDCKEFELRRRYIEPEMCVDMAGGNPTIEHFDPRIFYVIRFFQVPLTKQLLDLTTRDLVSARAVVNYAGKIFYGSIFGLVYCADHQVIEAIRFQGKDIT